MKCPVCGEEMKDGMNFCTNCGNKLPKHDNKKKIVVPIVICIAVLGIVLGVGMHF